MFTICPKCALTLLVTAEDLRVAQGYVRCGRCSSVFNALARLAEERQELGGPPESAPAQPSVEESPAPTPPPPASARARARASDAAPSTSPPPPPPPGVSDEDAIPDDALEFDPTRTDVSSVFVEPPPNPQWSAATGTFKAMMAANQEAVQTAEAEPQAPKAAPERRPPQPPHPQPPETIASPLERPSAQQESARARKRPPDSPRPEAAPATDPDPDIEVEIGMEMLASILHVEPPAEPPAPASPRSASTAPVTPSAPREPSAMVRRLRGTRPGERPPVKEPAPAAAPSEDLVTQQPPTAPQRPAPSTPAAAAPAPTPTPTPTPTPAEPDAAPAAPPFKRVLRIVRPTGGEWLVSLAWGAGTLAAALVLVAQIVNHYRDELAANARFNRPLTAIYAALGVHLMPRWDVKAYDVRQLGASVEPGGAGLITVRASVKNAAAQPQPLPLLRVTLQDRFGNRIAARDVGPRFYLARGAPGFLSAGERIDAEMGFVDPGANAVGFEIDACLPTSDGAVTCANDTASR
jgi:predicted Zn finger-like uncharacterized protein